MEARRLVGTMTFPVVILVAWLWLAGGPLAGVLPHAAHDLRNSVHVQDLQHTQQVNLDYTLAESRDFLRLVLARALPLTYPARRFIDISVPHYAPHATALSTSSS